jgi:hypothetical protein
MPAQSETVVQPISLLGIGILRSGTSFYARSARFRPQDSRVMTAYPGQRERRFIRSEEFAQDFVKRICEFDLFLSRAGDRSFLLRPASSPGIVAMAKTKKMATDDADDGYSYGE